MREAILIKFPNEFQEDVKLMADTGLEAYRFSISWSRLIPGAFCVVCACTWTEIFAKIVGILVKNCIHLWCLLLLCLILQMGEERLIRKEWNTTTAS
jgi:beta-glucosidase/6-phospho-beta-glucosidase/beta-galactosidase